MGTDAAAAAGQRGEQIITDIYCDLSELQARLYADFQGSRASAEAVQALRSGDARRAAAAGSDDTGAAGGGGDDDAPSAAASAASVASPHVFAALHYLRKLVSHPALVMDLQLPAHRQQQDLSNPPAACFILIDLGPGSGPLRVYSQNFDRLTVDSPAVDPNLDLGPDPDIEPTSGQASTAPNPDHRHAVPPSDSLPNASGPSARGGGTRPVEDRHKDGPKGSTNGNGSKGSTNGAIASGPTTAVSFSLYAADASGASSDFCSWRVTPSGVSINASVGGARLWLRTTTDACAAAEPWGGPGGPDQPEGWLARFGFLLRLEYDVLTLRTSVQYDLQEDEYDGGGAIDGTGAAADSTRAAVAATTAAAAAAAAAATEPGGGVGTAAAAALGAALLPPVPPLPPPPSPPSPLWRSGAMHFEKNWGAAFPDQWVWAQGHHSERGHQASFVFAGGLLPHVFQPALPAVRQYVLSYHPPPPAPPLTIDPYDPPLFSSLAVRGCDGVLAVDLYTPMHVGWYARVSDSEASSSFGIGIGHYPGGSAGDGSARIASFVFAGGLLPHVFQPALPAVRQYVLSYHPPPPAPPLTIDPYDPPLFSSLAVRGCDGVLAVDLYTPMHVVRLVASADPQTFQALPCPTDSGFRNYSVESFSARVQLRVLRRPFPFAPPASAVLVAEDDFSGAALEFGGAYVCPERMPQLRGMRGGRAEGKGEEEKGEGRGEGQGEGKGKAPAAFINTILKR
ncbi:TATA-binding protein-associated factor [Tetrabaena socialis]|uniref:TATA-binding protein-associated factor n=1 Tax=Tetrabaena socialis TaxID=47790 RepID=A0A2J8A7U3_9CHLO|nr:TATA-binding protein-associated factor [Tetrabaena socialis]|eukprot:PNH08543.1 TATA-binding protein-associated factor [Tetrabaena socialis]